MFPAPEAEGHGGLHWMDYQPLLCNEPDQEGPPHLPDGREGLCAQVAKGSPSLMNQGLLVNFTKKTKGELVHTEGGLKS